MKKHIKSVVSLMSICLVVALLLAVTNYITDPLIKKNEDMAANAALLEVMPDGEEFEPVDITKYTLPVTVEEVYGEKNGGYVFRLRTAGYSPNMLIMCGVKADGSVSGAVCLSSGETLGYEQTYGESFKGKTVDDVESVDTVAGATKTTSAYRSAVSDALKAFAILGGESLDIRTEEEKLADNLTAALPAAEGAFEEYFITEVLDGVDAVYAAQNNSGYVLILGEQFVGVDALGKVVSEDISVEIKDKTEDAAKIFITSKLNVIDISKYSTLPTSVTSASRTDSGNFVIELKASGYGIVGDYHASGEYINIRVSLTADGKIIACQTVSQGESKGFGAACSEREFYSQFNGKDENNYGNIDAISGATITTNAYKNVVGKAFEAVKILVGEAK